MDHLNWFTHMKLKFVKVIYVKNGYLNLNLGIYELNLFSFPNLM